MNQSNQTPAYRNASLSPEERAADLLSRMTLEEKVAQLSGVWIYEILKDQAFDAEKAAQKMAHGIGQITRLAGASSLGPAACAQLANQVQRFLLEHTRLGIPAMIHEETCSGLMARNATAFPQIIGCASTWDPRLVQEMTEVIRAQTRAIGSHHALAPVLDIARDPRYGRIEETFGEDPYLTTQMGLAYVQGLQGDDLTQGIIATGKHFVGYSAPEGGLNWAPSHIGARELREVHLLPFEAAVKQAGLKSMMNAYQEMDGVPCAVSRELFTGILREEWGFDGMVVSDYMAINQVADYHRLAQDKAHAARLTLEAGIDLELPSTDCYGSPLLEAVRQGQVPESLVDAAVTRILRLKFALGLFEHPFVEEEPVTELFDTPEQRRLARKMARKSMVLLKNADNLLPLSKEMGRIAVIGPNADNVRNLLGDYSYPVHIEILQAMHGRGLTLTPLPESLELADNFVPIRSVLDAIRERVSPQTEVVYAKGCDVLAPETDGFAAAVEAARAADVAILVVGDKSGLTPDCTTGEFRDRATLGLPGVQGELVKAVWETGTPVVLVLVNGRPFALPWEAEHVPAILEAWLPGEEGADAIADVLFGDYNPGGKLPVTVPRSVGQVPIFYSHRPSGGRSFLYGPYVDESNEPLYPFGFGLSYTRFQFGNLSITPDQARADGTVQVAVEVTNVGDRVGDEVVQLYTRTEGASVTQPVKLLRGFRRVKLQPGETRTIVFHLPVSLLCYYDLNMDLVVEPGEVQVMVGPSAADTPLTGRFTIVGETHRVGAERPFSSQVEVR